MKFKVLTDKSKDLSDVKDYVSTPRYTTFSKHHIEFYCTKHVKVRLAEYCEQDALIDIVISGTDILIQSWHDESKKCQDKTCIEKITYRVTRDDNF